MTFDVTGYAITQLILNDALGAIVAIYGDEGLSKVVEHMKQAAKSRQSNAEMDALESMFEARN
jgi:hypothetical protein